MEKNNAKPTSKKKYYKSLPPYAEKFADHQKNLWYLFNNNAEVRRYCANGIVNYLKQMGKLPEHFTHKYVQFKFDRFAVAIDGLVTEYRYTEPFFAPCFAAAFTCFAADAQKKLDEFLRKEAGFGIDKAIDESVVAEIINTCMGDAGVETEKE